MTFFFIKLIVMDNNLITLNQAAPDVQKKFMTGVYMRMAAALLITAAVSFFTASSYDFMRLLFQKNLFFAFIIAELALVIILSAAIRKLTPAVASLCFFLYAVINGITLSSIFIIYQLGSIFRVFVSSALMCGGMSIYGATTKSGLRSAGRYLYMALMGLIIASLVNLIFHSSGLDWLISIIGVGVFVGITAYDTQKLMTIGIHNDGSENFQKMAIIGALELYLDFINIFLKMLRLFGKKK